MEFKMKPIGVMHSPFKEPGAGPIQPGKSSADGSVEIFPEFEPGLKDLEGFSHIMLLYAFHKSKGFKLRVTPFLSSEKKGLFATCYHKRPNPIGLSVVELLERKGNTLQVRGIDTLEGTPLLDIKPYVPPFVKGGKTRIGWLEGKLGEGN